MDIRSVRLTDAQVSALECRRGGGLGALTEVIWGGERWIAFHVLEADELANEITEAANAEDGQAEEQRRRGESSSGARGAALALTNLVRQIRQAATT
jgi:hypothetical protein